MDKRNHFSDKFGSKSSEELKKIIKNKDYQKEAQLAAVWELERRQESNETDEQVAEKIIRDEARKTELLKSSRKYETFWPRFVASILDGIALMLLNWLLTITTNNLSITIYIILAGMLYQFSPFIYSIIMHGYYGQTLGKMAMKVKVVDFKTEERITMTQAWLRDCIPLLLMLFSYFSLAVLTNGFQNERIITNSGSSLASIVIMIINGLSISWVILEIVSMLMNEKSRAIHDLIAKTVVVRVD